MKLWKIVVKIPGATATDYYALAEDPTSGLERLKAKLKEEGMPPLEDGEVEGIFFVANERRYGKLVI